MPQNPIEIQVRSPAEPLTPAANPTKDGEDAWASCDAYRILRDQISRYARGEILGQSILIAGHRGSGKTTVTHLAIQRVRWAAEGFLEGVESSDYRAIPFLVPINGPDLVLEHERRGDDGKLFAEAALFQIRRALHRALSEEIGKRFVTFCEKHSGLHAELSELAYQLRIELDNSPPLGLLRSYWKRAGLLDRGLLNSRANPSQAFKEILALHTATEAIRSNYLPSNEAPPVREGRTSVGQASVRTGEGFTEGFRTMQPDRVGEAVRIAAPVLSLLAGGYAANAVATSLGPILAGAIGITTVTLAYSFLARTLLPRHDATLTGDASAGAQDLLLPVLVDRIFDAGFAPIFVVDELDKISGDLDKVLEKLMTRLKYVVTDRAFFCFLADRAYYERFHRHVREAAHPVEETYFADRLLIYHQPSDLSQYLEATYEIPPNSAKGNTRAGIVKSLLRPLMLSQSMGHVGELASVVKKNTEERSVQLLQPEIWRVPGYRMQILVQLAIEAVFEDSRVKAQLRQEPEFTQWLNDALYYVPGQWRKEAHPKIWLDAAPKPQPPPGLGALLQGIAMGSSLSLWEHSVGLDPPKPNLDHRDLKFVFDQMTKLTAYLETPSKLALHMLESKNSPSATLAVVVQSLPLLETEEGRCRWLFDQHGLPWAADAVTPPPRADAWQKAVEGDDCNIIIAARFALLDELTSLLNSGLGQARDLGDLFAALDTFPDHPEQTAWQRFRDEVPNLKDAANWKSWLPTLKEFEKFVDKLDRPSLTRLIGAEVVIFAEWRERIFALLAIARHTHETFAAIVAKHRESLASYDSVADAAGVSKENLKFLSSRNRFSAPSLAALRDYVSPPTNPDERTR